MREINCHIPITLRITGRPSDAQLDQLGESLVRALAARIAFAEQTILFPHSGRSMPADLELMEEAYDPSREDPSAHGYQVPSYQDQGRLTVVRWRRRIIPPHLKAGILARGRARLPTRNVRWLLEINKDTPWVSRLAVDLTQVWPEVDVTVDLFQVQDLSLTDPELTHVFHQYLEQRHASELAATPYYVFHLGPLSVWLDLQAALQIDLERLVRVAGFRSPREALSRQTQRYVLLTYASFPSDIELFIPTEITFEGEVLTGGVSAGLEPSEIPEQLIDRFTSWGNLDEGGLGAYLLGLTRQSPGLSRYVERVLDELGSTDRDDVSLYFAQSATDRDLDRLVSSPPYGTALLERLFDELTSGSIGESEQQQAERILAARARFRPLEVAAEQFARRRRLIFPFRLPGLTVFDDAPIQAERIGGGRIRVKMPVRVAGTVRFRAETQTLPSEVFTSGLELDADEWISVKIYDEGGIIVHRPALYLIELSNRTTTRTWENIGTTVAIGLSLGVGGAAAGGGAAARATLGARAIAFLDRAAAALFVVSTLVRDHRGWIIETFGETGRRFVEAVEVAGALAGVYGLVRVATATPQLIAGLRTAWRNWRSSRAFRELSGDDLRRAEEISWQAEQLLNDADEAAAAIRGGVRAGGPGAAIEAAGETPRVILYRGTVYRFVRGRSRQVHDLGDGVYMTFEPELAVRYAQIRRVEVQAVEPGAPGIVLRVEAEPAELGRVLDLYNNRALRAEWESFLRRQPGGDIVLRGGPAEIYNAHFENWLQTRGLSPKQFDVIIGPEYIRGGSQVCIRNEGIANSLLRRAEEWARAHEPVTPAYPGAPAPRLPDQ